MIKLQSSAFFSSLMKNRSISLSLGNHCRLCDYLSEMETGFGSVLPIYALVGVVRAQCIDEIKIYPASGKRRGFDNRFYSVPIGNISLYLPSRKRKGCE